MTFVEYLRKQVNEIIDKIEGGKPNENIDQKKMDKKFVYEKTVNKNISQTWRDACGTRSGRCRCL